MTPDDIQTLRRAQTAAHDAIQAISLSAHMTDDAARHRWLCQAAASIGEASACLGHVLTPPCQPPATAEALFDGVTG